MKYNLSTEFGRISAQVRLNKLKASGDTIELTAVKQSRTVKQNSYIHVLFCLFGIECGLTLEESKTFLKRECPFMRYEKKGFVYLRSTADLDTMEMTTFIEWVRNYSAMEVGLYLPTPQEYIEGQIYIDNQIKSHGEYL